MTDWQRFVLEHGARARSYELAAVLGRSVADIERVRATGACSKTGRIKRFAELFSLWRGRAPRDDEWPKPSRAGTSKSFEWQAPELALLATLVGRMDKEAIAKVLTNRLRQRTGDPRARRSAISVLIRQQHIGLQARDIVGGLTASDAGREVGSYSAVIKAIEEKRLPARKLGHHLVISHRAWQAFKAARKLPPKGYVQLSTIRQALAVRSDKLSEFARAGLVPGAVLCNPFTAKNARGVWFIDGGVARKMVRDRHTGRPMPWQGIALPVNMEKSYALWRRRQHPTGCKACRDVWAPRRPPRTFEDYCRLYPALTLGAKRHLTRRWSKAAADLLSRRERMTYSEAEAARRAGISVVKLRQLVKEVGWRRSRKLSLPLVQAIVHRQTRLEARTIAQAAAELGTDKAWVKALIAEGTIRVKRARWDRRVVCITRPMFARLKRALSGGSKRRLGKSWLQLKDAAVEAGVSTSQVQIWAKLGEIVRRRAPQGWRYPRWAVRARARRYWKTVRLHRAVPPMWLQEERGKSNDEGQRGKPGVDRAPELDPAAAARREDGEGDRARAARDALDGGDPSWRHQAQVRRAHGAPAVRLVRGGAGQVGRAGATAG